MPNRLYIGRLSDRARERDVEDFLRGYGKIQDIILKSGYGFVDLDDERDADDAVHDLHGRELCGERVILERARGPTRRVDDFGGGRRGYGGGGGGYGMGSSFRSREPERPSWVDKYGPVLRTQHRLVVENLSSRVSWQDLKDFMRSAGEVTFAEAHKATKNEGVVEFATRGDMKNAKTKLDGTELNGRKIKLIEDVQKSRSRSPRRRRHSDSGDRSRSRGRRDESRDASRSADSRGGGESRSRSQDDDRRSRDRDDSRDRD